MTRNTFQTLAALMLGVALLALAGCGKGHDDHDHAGHDHAAHKHDDDGHDHAGHDHGPSTSTAPKQADHDDDHAGEIRLTPQAIERWQVKVQQAGKHALSEQFTVPARVSYNLEAVAHVGSLITGRVGAIHARAGDVVKPGDALLEISSPELGQAQSDYLQKIAGIDGAQSALRIATTLHDNARKLHEQSQGIALSEVQKREADMLAADAAVKAAVNAAAAAKNHLLLAGMDGKAIEALEKTGAIDPLVVVRSPIAGRVIERSVAKGEAVTPERDALFILANLDTLWVLADVPESYIGKVGKQSRVTIRTPGSAAQTFEGGITYIAPELDPVTRTLQVRAQITGQHDSLKPGMFVQADIAAGDDQASVLAIPESAMQVIDGQACVFVPVAGEAGTFTRRIVTLGPQVGRMLPVISGLREGESFVATGSFILKAELGKASAGHEH